MPNGGAWMKNIANTDPVKKPLFSTSHEDVFLEHAWRLKNTKLISAQVKVSFTEAR